MKYFMIGNTHYDPVWEWTWDEAMASIRATFRSALDRMKEYDDFCYSFSSPTVFEQIKDIDPEMFEEICKRVREGRWDLAEGWWNQPDCFSASGECYVRQGLYGQRYLKENFGMYSECAFNTDSFGHPDMLPQILSRSGIKYYCMCRPEQQHYHLDTPLFTWESRDGSCVTAYRIGGDGGDGWAADTAEVIAATHPAECDAMIVYGVTDHGGAPTKKSIEQILNCSNAQFSTVGGYFKAQGKVAGKISDEFVTGDFGVYCNHSRIKRMNRRAEYALLNAEKSCVMANRERREALSGCWKDVLFNQFHDILGGASVKNAYIDAENLYGRAIQTANEILHLNLQHMTAKLRMPGKNPDNAWNLVLWNMNCCEYNDYVEAEVQWAHEFEWYDGGITLEDEEGGCLETQIISEYSAIPRFRSRFVFKVSVPPMGCKIYKVVRNGKSVKKDLSENPFWVETTKRRYEISKKNGSICAVYDRKSGERLASDMFIPSCYRDDGDTWCFNTEGYGEKLGEFEVVKGEIVENGEIVEKVKVTLEYEKSVLYMYYTFYKNENYFNVDYTVNWNECHTVFKLDFAIDDDEVTVATPYSSVIRAKCAWDKPMGEWLKTSKNLFVTDSNFAYNFNDGKLGITVLRSPIYGDLRICELPKRDYSFMEQGVTEGKIRVIPMDIARTPQEEVACMNNCPTVVCESNHDGANVNSKGFLSLEAREAEISTVKYAEDGNGIVLRAVSYSKETQNAVLTVEDREYTFSLGAYEIKTLRIAEGVISENDMIEGYVPDFV